MKISKDTHTQVIFWAENGLVEKFDRIADMERSTRAELLRNSMQNTIKKHKALT